MELKEKINEFEEQIYFFILKKVKNKDNAKDILQNVNLKALENFGQIKNFKKLRAWLYQTARNEISNFYSQENKYDSKIENISFENSAAQKQTKDEFCCFDRFIDELPPIYKSVIEQIYINGKTQKQTAEMLNISLPGVKARSRRAKSILKIRFEECCNYQTDKNGNLTGDSDCSICNSILGIS